MKRLLAAVAIMFSCFAGTALADGQGTSSGPLPCTHSDSWLDAIDPNYGNHIYTSVNTHCEYQIGIASVVTTDNLQYFQSFNSKWVTVDKEKQTWVSPDGNGDVVTISNYFVLNGGYVGCSPCQLYRVHANVQVNLTSGAFDKVTYNSSYIASGYLP